MNTIYLSNGANPQLQTYLSQLGNSCDMIPGSPLLSEGIASHPDLFMCKMGCQLGAPVFCGDAGKPRAPYPKDIPYNAACTGKFFIHRLAFTDAALLRAAKEMNMILIDVPQGYTKCNVVVVDENSLITSDKGIFDVLDRRDDIDCLLVHSGHVRLSGYSTGFLGGASGRVDNRILFHGSLPHHPDAKQIQDFIESRGFDVIWFDGFPLTDIGSIIEKADGVQNIFG